QQFDEYHPSTLLVQPCSHGGFAGLQIYCEGTVANKEQALLGWSMQMPILLSQEVLREGSPLSHQKAADYTIKVVGSPSAIAKNKDALVAFSNSFELIDEIAMPP